MREYPGKFGRYRDSFERMGESPIPLFSEKISEFGLKYWGRSADRVRVMKMG